MIQALVMCKIWNTLCLTAEKTDLVTVLICVYISFVAHPATPPREITNAEVEVVIDAHARARRTNSYASRKQLLPTLSL